MPLVACPDCGRPVSDMAPACPDCARPLARQHTSAAPRGVGTSRCLECGGPAADAFCDYCRVAIRSRWYYIRSAVLIIAVLWSLSTIGLHIKLFGITPGLAVTLVSLCIFGLAVWVTLGGIEKLTVPQSCGACRAMMPRGAVQCPRCDVWQGSKWGPIIGGAVLALLTMPWPFLF